MSEGTIFNCPFLFTNKLHESKVRLLLSIYAKDNTDLTGKPVIRLRGGKKLMIHKFKLTGYNIVIDVNSGTIHVVDDLTYDLLDNIEPPFSSVCPEEVLEKLQKFHRKEDIWTCYDEVVELYNSHGLFTEDTPPCECTPEEMSLKAVCLNISHDCNLKCRYCFAGNGLFGGERSMMSEETAFKSVDFLMEHSGDANDLEIYFFGGEPLMNFDVLKSTVTYAKKRSAETGKNIRFSLTTNGTYLNDEITDFINAEIDSVVLSADGRKEINDSVRCHVDGSGTYDEIIPKFRKLVDGRNGKPYCIRGTFTKNNPDFSNDVFSLYEAGFDCISIEPVAPGSGSYSLTGLELPQVFREYDRLCERLINAEKEGHFIEFFPFSTDVLRSGCAGSREKACGCGSEYIAVTPSGDIYPCHQFTGEENCKLGNINEGTFDTGLRFEFAKARVSAMSSCRECWAKYFCGGGCRANSFRLSGDITTPHKLTCQLLKKRIECGIVLMAARAELEGEI